MNWGRSDSYGEHELKELKSLQNSSVHTQRFVTFAQKKIHGDDKTYHQQ